MLAISLALAALVTAALASAAPSRGALPRSPIYLGAGGTEALAVRPATITYTGDGTGFLGGRSARGRDSRIVWSSWTARKAIGRGFNQLNDCRPYCAAGKFHGYAVRIEAWRPRTLGGKLVFTRLTIFYLRKAPSGEPRHYTFTDAYADGRYGWGPPGQQGYCTRTQGEKPAPGCQNIHSLP